MKSLSGSTTRPTGDKIKGAIFNMLGGFFDEGTVLDLYAGSGGLAIEAISRGFEKAILVERDRAAQQIIQANIEMTKEGEKFQLKKMSAELALAKLTEKFDLVFLDPPYAQAQILSDIEKLEARALLSDKAKIVVETEKSVDLPELIGRLSIWKQKVYGVTKITIYAENDDLEENDD